MNPQPELKEESNNSEADSPRQIKPPKEFLTLKIEQYLYKCKRTYFLVFFYNLVFFSNNNIIDKKAKISISMLEKMSSRSHSKSNTNKKFHAKGKKMTNFKRTLFICMDSLINQPVIPALLPFNRNKNKY